MDVSDKENPHFSKKHNCNLPYAIKLDEVQEIYLHQIINTRAITHGNSQGCIYLAPGDAEEVFDWLQEKTRVIISYPW